MDKKKRVVVSCGPIPARLDSVKFLTNRFKGGLAFRTAEYLAKDYDVTVVAWRMTDLPAGIRSLVEDGKAALVTVMDVFEYYDWFVANAKDYDAFVMAAAVANLTPVHPYEGKFPSHNYKPGDEFDIRFMIAPRAIDAVKRVNPRACLIGYKLFDAPDDAALVEIARHTLADSKANIIFANTPAHAKDRKLALTQDGSVIPCSFQEHLELVSRAIGQEYFRTELAPLTEAERDSIGVREALATVEMFEKTFDGYGTVAVPVAGMDGAFATTSRGHGSGPVLVRGVDPAGRVVRASGKATLNAPALSAMLGKAGNAIVVHRHYVDPLADESLEPIGGTTGPSVTLQEYVFPGTMEEYEAVLSEAESGAALVHQRCHGYLKRMPVLDVDWGRYHELFPEKYFRIPDGFRGILDRYAGKETLEIGGNDGATGKYSYDPYVSSETATNLALDQVMGMRFDLAFAKNAVNYVPVDVLHDILGQTDAFVANTFLEAPDEKVTDVEAAVLDADEKKVRHTLRLRNDAVMRHWFFAYARDDYERLGLDVVPYGRNSALVLKNCRP